MLYAAIALIVLGLLGGLVAGPFAFPVAAVGIILLLLYLFVGIGKRAAR